MRTLTARSTHLTTSTKEHQLSLLLRAQRSTRRRPWRVIDFLRFSGGGKFAWHYRNGNAIPYWRKGSSSFLYYRARNKSLQKIANQDPGRARQKSEEGTLMNITQPRTKIFSGSVHASRWYAYLRSPAHFTSRFPCPNFPPQTRSINALSTGCILFARRSHCPVGMLTTSQLTNFSRTADCSSNHQETKREDVNKYDR